MTWYRGDGTQPEDGPAQLRKTEEAQAEAKEVSRKQGKVEKLTRKLANKINKENQANG